VETLVGKVHGHHKVAAVPDNVTPEGKCSKIMLRTLYGLSLVRHSQIFAVQVDASGTEQMFWAMEGSISVD